MRTTTGYFLLHNFEENVTIELDILENSFMRNRKMINRRRKPDSSLTSRIHAVLLGIVLLLTVSFFISVFFIIKRERRENAVKESETLLITLGDSICSDIERYKEISRLVMIENRLVAFLRADSDKVSDYLRTQANFGILDTLNVTTMVDSVFVFRNDGQYVSTNRGKYMFDYDRMESNEWKNNILSEMGAAVYSINGDNALYKINNRPIVTISRAVYDITTQKRTGIMLMNISDLLFEDKLYKLGVSDILIMGSDGTYLAGDTSLEKYFSDAFNSTSVIHREVGNGMLVSGTGLGDIPIVIICASRMKSWIYPFETAYVLIFLLLVFFLAIFWIGTFITGNLTTPLTKLIDAMENSTKEGKLEKIDIDMPHNEISVLRDSYNAMVERVNSLFERLMEKEKTVQRAEMRMLHEQIKPHFLYNSLETIGYLAMDAGAEEVHKALETLGSFYRNFLSKGEREITLRTELSIIKDYLALQKLRYGDIINDEYDIDENTLNCRIPKLILQPIVENSIYHGIRLKGEMGTIRISSHFINGYLHLSVYDTGIGMEQEQIDEILSKKHYNGDTDSAFADIYDTSDSFGLWGTIERVRGFCENDDVVRIISEPGEFTEVAFMIKPKS